MFHVGDAVCFECDTGRLCGRRQPLPHFICCGPWKVLKKACHPQPKKAFPFLWGPISMPDYLDRNQMVTVAGKNEVALDEFNRWAESLRESFYRVLLEDLSYLLKTPRIYRYDRSGEEKVDYQITIDVTRFDCAPEGDAVLTAFWTVNGKERGTPGITKKSVFRTPVSSPGFSGMADALNRTLTAFGREIASAIESMQP